MLVAASRCVATDMLKAAQLCTTSVRHKSRHDPVAMSHKAWKYMRRNYKEIYIRERYDKVQKTEYPNFHEPNILDLPPQEIRLKMKRMGVQPPTPWNEKPLYMASTSSSFERYLPPEGDAKKIFISKEGAKQNMNKLVNTGKNKYAMRKIYNFDDDFDIKSFAIQAQEIFIKANEALIEEDDDKLHEYVTEMAYPRMKHLTERKTIRWKVIKSLEPPRAVQVRVTNLVDANNLFAQITVRMNTQQTLAIYDRFGRLIHGSEEVIMDSLEYIIFEKNISNSYGAWRVHDRIVPSWAPKPSPIKKTYKAKPEEVEEEEEGTVQQGEGKVATAEAA